MDTQPYTTSINNRRIIYDADTGEIYALLTYRIRLTSSSPDSYGRALFKADLSNNTLMKIWEVESESENLWNIPSPFSMQLNTFMVLKDGRVYLNWEGYSASDLKAHPEITSCFAYLDNLAVLKNILTLDNIHFLPGVSEQCVYDTQYVLNLNFPYGRYNGPIKFFVLNHSNELCVCGYDPSFPIKYMNDSNSSTSVNYCYLAIIDTNSNKFGAHVLTDSHYFVTMEHTNINGHPVFFSNYGGNDSEKFMSYASKNKVCQPITCFSVPESSQVRPENSGVRIVYELTISNPT